MSEREFVDALRAVLGLPPLGGDPVRSETERFQGAYPVGRLPAKPRPVVGAETRRAVWR